MSMRQRSVPFFADKRPEDVITDGSRLDGRGHEEFRSACTHLCTATSLSWREYYDFMILMNVSDDNLLVRAVFDCGTVTQASGSAYVEFGSTKLVVAVYGPRQPDRGNTYSEEGFLECDVRLATFATRQRGRPGQSAQEREWTSQLETALAAAIRFETFPKAVLDVQCLVMESGGAVLPAAVCGASLALAEAGIEMLDLVSSVSVVRLARLL